MPRLATRFAALAICALTTAACTTRITDFTVISTKNLSLVGERGSRVTGRDCVYIVLIFPTGVINLKEAIDRTIESAGAGYDALIDGVVSSYGFYIPLIYGQSCFEVEGTPIKTRSGAASLDSKVLRHSRAAGDDPHEKQSLSALCEQISDPGARETCLRSLGT